MDPLNSFKFEIDSMFEKTFQDLSMKNNLNKTILTNLIEAAQDQQRKIQTLDHNIQVLHKSTIPQTSIIKSQLHKQEEVLYDNFNKMMGRLNHIEEGITHSRNNVEKYQKNSEQIENKMDKMIGQLEKIEKQQGVFYSGNKDDFLDEIEDFQKIMKQVNERSQGITTNLDFSNKIHLQQPMNTFETKITLHNKNNQQILRTRLIEFTDRVKKLEKKIEQTSYMMNSELNKSRQDQKKIIEQVNYAQKQMHHLRSELDNCDQKRKKSIQNNALSLDNMVQDMLGQAKKLEVRVENLRKGYQEENKKSGQRNMMF